MSPDDALDQGQTVPRSLELVLGVQPLEDTEELMRESVVESDAVVLDVVVVKSLLSRAADLYRRCLALARELHGVGEQVEPHLPQHRRITVGDRQRPAW